MHILWIVLLFIAESLIYGELDNIFHKSPSVMCTSRLSICICTTSLSYFMLV